MSITAQALARTYSDRVYTDPWEKVRDYQRVQQYAADHPNAGRTVVGRALDLPPSRVRAWLNGGMPDPMRGIQTAIDNGWLEADSDGEMARALVELLAHVLAGGSVDRLYRPNLTPGRRVDEAELQQTFAAVGLDSTIQHANSDGRATEIAAAEDGSVLGRCLVSMGAVAGSKTDLAEFPALLDDVPPDVRTSFARIYARHRATTYDEKDTTRIMEARPDSYRRGLADLLADVTGESVTVDDRGVTLSAAASRALGVGREPIER